MSDHKPPCPGPEAHINPKGGPACIRHHKIDGLPCRGYKMTGQDVCRMHGGSSGQAKKKAAERAQLAQAHQAVILFAARRDIHPAEALLELVQWTAGEVDYWRQQVRELDKGDLTWGVTKVKDGGDDRGTTSEAKPNIAYVMLVDASKRLEAHCVAALRAGVEERRVRLAEHQGALLVQVIRQVLDQLHLTDEQQGLVPTVVPAALRLISGEVAS